MTKTVGDVIAERVRKYRTRRSWSVRQLAEECAKLGAPQLTAASLTNIERNLSDTAKRKRRDVTFDELLILAYALAVPPVLLVLPIGEDEDVTVIPGLATPSYALLLWFVGELDSPTGVPADPIDRQWVENARPAQLYSHVRTRALLVKEMRRYLADAEASGDEARAAMLREMVANQEGQLAASWALWGADALPEFQRDLKETLAAFRPYTDPSEGRTDAG